MGKLGDLNNYKSKEEIVLKLQEIESTSSSKMNDATANYEFKTSMSIGDIVIVKKGRGELLGYGEVKSNYYFDDTKVHYQKFRKVNWIKKGNWRTDHSLALKTLTDVTMYPTDHPNYEYYYQSLLGLMDDQQQIKIEFPLNTIFYGPPGTGKTYNTILRAAQIIEERPIYDFSEAQKIFNENLGTRIEFITFHQNYCYEDFIQGLRPDIENQNLKFNRVDGIFKKIVDRAMGKVKLPVGIELEGYIIIKSNADIIELKRKKDDTIRYVPTLLINDLMKGIEKGKITLDQILNRKDQEKHIADIIDSKVEKYYFGIDATLYHICRYLLEKNNNVPKGNYVLVIDEINRANISRVFGELITLIESDKCSKGEIPIEVSLPSGEKFMVPSNLYIIGTMNTADKSIALLDVALRRRFDFEPMYPLYHLEGNKINDSDILEKINNEIINHKGHDFQVGHSYFMDFN